MLLIATDEAGYGPKLGPLVVAATVWQVPHETRDENRLAQWFHPLGQSHRCGPINVRVDDSKSVYQRSAGLSGLHAVVSASHHWCNRFEPELSRLLPVLTPRDVSDIAGTPWLSSLSTERFVAAAETEDLLGHWRKTGIQLIDVRCRVITARRFNDLCAKGSNKADLLSQATLTLAKDMVNLHAPQHPVISVYCDRHGGRRYYGGVLQHTFPEQMLQVGHESKVQSLYQLHDHSKTLTIQFNVKGDSFTPVALASMHAKYLRERFMDSLNHFFAVRHRGNVALKPTAGYPVDADRYLRDIASILQRENIELGSLVRSR